MKDFNIFLSGGIKDLCEEDYYDWRIYAKEKLAECCPGVRCFNPPEHFNYLEITLYNNAVQTEKEIFRMESCAVRKSDLILANWNSQSIGTAMEIAIAHENKIPILLIYDPEKTEMYPWVEECADKIFYDVESAVLYILKHFIY